MGCGESYTDNSIARSLATEPGSQKKTGDGVRKVLVLGPLPLSFQPWTGFSGGVVWPRGVF